MSLLYALFGVIIVINIIFFLIIQKDSPLLNWMERTNNYMLYHIVLTFLALPLGEYGKGLREKSFAKALNSVGQIFVAAASKIKADVYGDIKNCGGGKKTLTVMEIGAGSGVNFDYYPEECDVIIVEPADEFKKIIEDKFKDMPGRRLKKFVHSGAEKIVGVEDNSVDAVITSEVLCSVKDPKKVLQEIQRVLKPGGKYYFFEHILDTPGKVRRSIQSVLNWKYLWPAWYMGCEFCDTAEVIAKMNFSQVNARKINVPFKGSLALMMCAPHYCGNATK